MLWQPYHCPGGRSRPGGNFIFIAPHKGGLCTQTPQVGDSQGSLDSNYLLLKTNPAVALC